MAEQSARPMRRRWAVEIHDGGDWVRWSSATNEQEARERFQRQDVPRVPRTWNNGQPVRRRLVQETTTWIVLEEQ